MGGRAELLVRLPIAAKYTSHGGGMTEEQRRTRRPCNAKAALLTSAWLACIAVIVFVPGAFAMMVGLDPSVAATVTAFTGLCVLVAGLMVNLR
jgi:hypothetical protein